MSPSIQLDPVTETQPQFNVPDFAHFREKFGWPESDASGYKIIEQLCGTERPMRVVALGGGVSGINLARFLPQELKNVSLTIYEKNPELGGTWYENNYPGVRCDIPSHNYQFTWARYPEWEEYYSSGREIQNYLLNVVRQFDLRKYFRTNHQVVGATWDQHRGVWDIQVENLLSGVVFIDTAEIFINNDGLLNKWKWPKIDGLTDFKGLLCHTAKYDASTTLDGKRVAVLGIGSSGIQVIPSIQPKVAHLYSFVRSPTWVTPMIAQKFLGLNGTTLKYTNEQKAEFRANPAKYQNYLKQLENEINSRFRSIMQGTPEALEAKKISVESMTTKLNGRTDIIDAIIPKNFNLGCRRPTPGTGFLEAVIQPNVTTFTKPMSRITEKGFIDHEGNEHEVDVIICATGFDVSWIPRFPIWVDGCNIQDVRKKETLSYLSLAIPEVPNYFGICGPYGPFAHGCYITVSELLTKNVIKVVRKVQRELIKSVRPKREVCEAFAQHADLFAKRTAWSGACSSWFKNGDVVGRLAVFPGSRLVYWDLLTDPRWEDYKIDYVGGNEFNFMGNGFHVREFAGGDKSYYLGDIDDPVALLPPTTNGHTEDHFPKSARETL